LNNECIVQRIEESNLNQLGVLWLGNRSIGVRNNFGQKS
jgi:hypothetical protein